MSNLSELLPSGGGQNVVEFTASGTVASGKPVILNTNGTVTQVAESTTSPSLPLGSILNFNSQGSEYYSVKADPFNNDRWIIAWMDDVGTKYVRVRVVTRSGTTLTTSSISNADTTGNASYVSVEWDKNQENVFLLVYTLSSYGYAKVGTVSGSAGSESFSYGTRLDNWSSSSAITQSNNRSFDLRCMGTTGNFIVGFNNTSNYPSCRVLSVSSTSVTAPGSTVVIQSNSMNSAQFAVNPGDSDKVVAMYQGNNKVRLADLSISGTTVTVTSNDNVIDSSENQDEWFGVTPVSGDSSTFTFITLSADTGTSRGSCYLNTLSGGTFTMGSKTNISTSATNDLRIDNNVDGDKNTFICVYNDNSTRDYFGVVGTISGSSLSFASESELADAITISGNFQNVAQQSDDEGNFLAVYRQSSDTNGRVVLGKTGGTTTNLTSTNFIGLASAAISDTASGDINVKGGINEAQSSLTIGSDYYVQTDGTLGTTADTPSVKVGQAITATTINMMDLT